MEGDSPGQDKDPPVDLPVPVSITKGLFEPDGVSRQLLHSLFTPDTPLWISFFPVGDRKLSGFLSWLDIWHSGMISKGLSPYMKNLKPYPEHFLFYPADTPVPNGILIIPYEKGRGGERLPFLPDTLMGLSVEHVILDLTTLPSEVRSSLPVVSVLATPDLKITVRIGKKEDYPETMESFLQGIPAPVESSLE